MNNKSSIISIILILVIGGLLVLALNFDKIMGSNTSNENNNQEQEEEKPSTSKTKTYTLTYFHQSFFKTS